MSHCKPYPAYRDSGVEWLGMVPEHWQVKPLKRVLRLITERAGTCDWQVALENIEGWTGRFSETESEFSGEGISFNPGDILFGKLRPYLAKAYVAPRSGEAVGDFFVLRPIADGESEFLYRYILTPVVIEQINAATEGAKMPRASWDDMGLLPVAIPERDEQIQIVQNLDRETARIDALVAKKTRFIELLREKRQALITHAVTKGLDPNVKMKDSGVEWLGEVPEHWDVKAIRWLSPVQRGASPRPIDDPVYFDDDGEYGWVRIEDVTASDGFLEETKQRLSELGSSLSVKLSPGALFLSIAGSVGKPCITRIKACIHDGFVYFPLLKTDPMWLVRIFESRSPFVGLGKLGTQLNLNTETVGSIKVALPPAGEISEILSDLDRCLAHLGQLISRTEHSITLLKERRSALITAAVTGQIDLREAV